MKIKTVFAGLVMAAIFMPATSAQETSRERQPKTTQETSPTSTDRTVNIQLSERGGLAVPENLLDLKTLSLAFWIKFRGTNQRVYFFVNEAAQFHAYAQVCKRHELNISQGPIIKLANRYIQAAIPAHYDEPEYELLDPLSKKQQQDFFEDMAGDLYAFEYGFRFAEQMQKIKGSGLTKKLYCEGVEKEFKLSYIALRATAMRRLAEFDEPAEKK